MARIQQHNIGEVRGGVGCKYLPPESLPHQVGQVAAVVDMRVGKDHCIDGLGIEREFQVALVRLLARPLEQTALQQQRWPLISMRC
jgi:hypothetical protein